MRRPAIVEVDAFYLPDTAGTTYRAEHVKTSIAVDRLDASAPARLFSQRRLLRARGRGLRRPLQSGGQRRPVILPPYVEVAKFGSAAAPGGQVLVATSIDLLRGILRAARTTIRFAATLTRFPADLDLLAAGSLRSFTPTRSPRFASAARRSSSPGRTCAGCRPTVRMSSIESRRCATSSPRLPRPFSSRRRAWSDEAFLRSDAAARTMADAWDETMRRLALRYGALPART